MLSASPSTKKSFSPKKLEKPLTVSSMPTTPPESKPIRTSAAVLPLAVAVSSRNARLRAGVLRAMANLPALFTVAVAPAAPLACSQSSMVAATSVIVQAPKLACAPLPKLADAMIVFRVVTVC